MDRTKKMLLDDLSNLANWNVISQNEWKDLRRRIEDMEW